MEIRCSITRYRAASRRPSGVRVFCDEILHRHILQRHVGKQALELGVLGFQLLDPFQVGGFHAAVFGLPLVVGGVRDAVLPANFLDRPTSVSFLQNRNDLVFGKSRFLHLNLLAGEQCQKALLSHVRNSGKFTQ